MIALKLFLVALFWNLASINSYCSDSPKLAQSIYVPCILCSQKWNKNDYQNCIRNLEDEIKLEQNSNDSKHWAQLNWIEDENNPVFNTITSEILNGNEKAIAIGFRLFILTSAVYAENLAGVISISAITNPTAYLKNIEWFIIYSKNSKKDKSYLCEGVPIDLIDWGDFSDSEMKLVNIKNTWNYHDNHLRLLNKKIEAIQTVQNKELKSIKTIVLTTLKNEIKKEK